MRNANARPSLSRYQFAFILVSAVGLASAIVAAPVYSARLGLFSSGKVQPGSVRERVTSTSKATKAVSFAQPVPETIATYASDCTTARSTFYLGETVCAKTDSVTLPPADNWWVNW